MAIDKARLKEFEGELNTLLDSLSFEEFYASFKAKMMEYVIRQTQNVLDVPTRREIKRELELMFSPEIAKYFNQILQDFNTTLSLVNQFYPDLSDEEITRDFAKIRSIEQVTASRLGEFEDRVELELAATLRKDLLAGENIRTISNHLGEIDDKVAFYADTIAKTGKKAYGRAAKAEKARLGEVFFYEYVGIIRGTTRPFCRALVGSTHHVDVIRQMRNGNLEPVLTYCGGWNCFHDWEPDPFATEGTEGDLQEIDVGKKTVKVFMPGKIEDVFSEGEIE